jgi:F420-dependent oxidoreductase-like protein
MAKRLAVRADYGATPAEHRELLQKVQIADELGVDSVWVSEAWGRDAFTLLTELALKTSRINVGTSIVNVFSRSPAVLAMTAATLDELSGGRMILGLGSSGANVIEHWHGAEFKRPLRRLREYVEVINLIVSGQPLRYSGEILRLERGFTLRGQGFVPPRTHIPIFIAALTPASLRQSAALADGVLPIFWPKERFPELCQTVQAAAEQEGRPAAAVTIAPMIGVFLTDGDDEQAVRQRARVPVAFYIGRMGRFYYEMLQRNGYAAEVEAVRAAWERRDGAAAADAVSDRLLQATAIVGPLDACAEQLDERRALGVDLPIVPLPPGAPAVCGKVLERLLS